MKILGAGMAGLLAGAMLRNKCTGILEAQPELPKNHSAVLRFRSPIIDNTLNIPFKKVKMIKAVLPWENPIADMMTYSYKTNGTYRMRSIISADGLISERFIAPDDFIEQLKERIMVPISFGIKVEKEYFENQKNIPIISTLPMPTLMNLLEWKTKPEFKSISGSVITADLGDCEAYCSIYIPHPQKAAYRISITGSKLLIEISHIKDEDIHALEQVKEALIFLGMENAGFANIQVKTQKFAKILPIDDNIRKRFILWATEHFNVYSLGRFATWRPNLLLDDLVNDVRQIQKFASSTNYDHRSKG